MCKPRHRVCVSRAVTFLRAETGRLFVINVRFAPRADLRRQRGLLRGLTETRIPASPASMVPSGAIRSLLPTGTCGIGLSVATSAPEDGTVGDSVVLTIIAHQGLAQIFSRDECIARAGRPSSPLRARHSMRIAGAK